AEGVGLGHEVSLAVDLDQRAQLAVGVEVGVHEAFLGLAPRPLLGVGEALLSEVFGGLVEVAVRGVERGLAVHHAGARALAELHDRLGVGGHQETSASAAAISLSLRGSMMNTAEGSDSIILMPMSAFSSFSRSRSSSSASFFGTRSNSPVSFISSSFLRRAMDLRIVAKFVSVPPSQRWLT